MAYHLNAHNIVTLNLPVYGAAAAISEGMILTPGVTADQDIGTLIPIVGAGSTAAIDLVGLTGRQVAAADRTDANPDGGAAATFGTLEPVNLIRPGDLICIEYNPAVDVDVASYSAPTVTITSLQDAYDGGWCFINDNTAGQAGPGQLGYCEASASGSVGLRDNFTTAPDPTSDAIMILPIGQLLVASSAGGVLLNSYAASTNYVTKFCVVMNQLTYRGKSGWEQMLPSLHSNAQLNGLNAKFRAVGFLRDLAGASID